MRRRRLHSKTFALIFSILIVLSSLTVVNPTFLTVGAKPTRDEENTLYVDDDAPGGGDGSLEKPYQKIQDAIDNATEEDTIRVFNGTYFENVEVDKRIRLIGNGSEETIITGDGSGKGILLDGISDSTIKFLKVENFEYGIYLIGLFESCDYNTFIGTTVSNNSKGIIFISSSHNTLAMNHLVKNGISITGFSLENYNSHSIATTNTVNGKPVRYYKNSEGITVPSGAGQIIIANCTNMVVKDQKLSNGNVGILVGYSSNITIQNNTCSNNNKHGIFLSNSNQNTLMNNTCSNNNDYGISLSNSDQNILTNNICSRNDYGINLGLSDDNILTNNIASYDNGFGIHIINSDHNTFTGNIASNSDWHGVYISKSDHNTLTNNAFSNNDNYALFLDKSSHNTISRSTICNNQRGIYLQYSSSYNTIQYNNIYDNRDYGINGSNNDGFSVDASNNWWGDASGPSHPVNNSAGKGDHVTDHVEFEPWVSEKLFNTLFVTKYGNDTTGNGSKDNPFLTLQRAVNESNDWDTIRVFEGVYEENVVVNKSIEIIGNNSEETIIDGLGGEYNDDEDGLNCRYIGGFGGAYQDVAYDGEYLYAVHSRGLSIFNVSDPSNPKEISFIQSVDPAFCITISGNYAYVADLENGLVIINISNPMSPEEEGHFNTEGYAYGVVVSGDYAYVADYTNGLIIVNISDPSNPNEEGHYDTVGTSLSVSVGGDYAYVADWTNGLVIVNISDPKNPIEQKQYDTAGGARDVDVSGDYAYVADDSNGLVIVNISNPSNPFEEGHYDTSRALGVALSRDYAYILDQIGGFMIVDIKDKENPTQTGEYDTTLEAWGLAVSEDFAYVADDLNGLVILNISDPGSPEKEGHYFTAAWARGVTVNGEYALIADQSSGLIIINISDNSNPVLEGHYPGTARGVAVSGDYAYVADGGNGIVILNISDPKNPQEEGHYDTEGSAYGVAVSNDYLYVADYYNGFVIVNISDKKNPNKEGHYNTAGFAWSVAVRGGYGYVADSENGLVIVNISDPSNPVKEGRFNTEDDARGIAVDGSYAYVADLRNGLVIVDISDPENPKEVGHFDTARADYMAVSGDYAYIADTSGLLIVNISDPKNPEEEGHYDTEGSAYGVALSDDFAYVANREHGLVIVEMLLPTNVIQITSRCKISGLTMMNGSRAGVLIDSDNVEIDLCKITGNYDGIKVINGSENIDIHNCDIIESNRIGINAQGNGGIIVDAIDNWWGHPSGPYHLIQNPAGIGNEVSDNVAFKPWFTRPKDFRIHFVAPDGNDLTGNGNQDNPYRTIQQAIDMANEWDTIEAAPGTYSGSITINKRNVTINGDSASTTIIDAGGANSTCTITADNIEFNGFTIENGMEDGILFVNSSGNEIVNCVFPDNSYDLNLSNSKNNLIINTTFETVNFNDNSSDISVLWPIDLKVTDNRSGFIPNAYLKLTDIYGTPLFNGYTDIEGKLAQINILEYYQNSTSQIDYNPYTISVWKIGYLDFSKDLNIESYSPVICELQAHILPIAIISGEIIQEVDMDSEMDFDGRESTGRSITYYWEFDDASSSSSPTPSHTFTSPGAYQVNLTVTDDYDNTSITSIIVIVHNVIPIARADSDVNSLFEDEALDFDASDSWDTSSDTLSFLWDFGDGTQSDKIMPTHSYENQGIYDVSLTAIDLFGGESSTHLFITVMNQAPWDVSAGGYRSVYSREIVEFQGSAFDTFSDLDNLKYLWDFGDGIETEGQNVGHTYYESGEYLVNLTVIDNDGATSYSLVTISVKNPKITTSVSRTSISQDEEVFFEATHELDDGSFIYTWYFGDGLNQAWNETYHTYVQSGIFSPYLIIHDGIENITIFVQEIVVNNVIPTPQIEVLPHQISEDESLLFDASNSEDSTSDIERLTYVWDFDDGTTDYGINVTHAFSQKGIYTVILLVSDGKAITTTDVEIEVQNQQPVANAGTPKVREATVGETVILDASGSTDTPSDGAELNYTWKIGNARVYGKVVSYAFVTAGEFIVTLTVRDDDGATSEDSLTFEVSKSSEPDDEDMMSSLNWILLLVIIVFLVVIGFLISKLRDEALYKEMKAEERAESREMMEDEETIVVEGVIDEETFKPKEDVQISNIEVVNEQAEVLSVVEVDEEQDT